MLELTAYSQAFISKQQEQKAEANQKDKGKHILKMLKWSKCSVLERGVICFGQKKK